MAFLLEIVATSAKEIGAAREGGADRLEVCAAIETGGLTPSPGLVEEALVALPSVAMLRPRQGSFVYDEDDRRVLLRDLQWLAKTEIEAVVFGALTDAGEIDIDLLTRVVAFEKPVVFHRAFDETSDKRKSLEALIESGVRRVLTSGGEGKAEDNLNMLVNLVNWAGGRIEILPGGGIRPENVQTILQAVPVHQVHAAPFRSNPTVAQTVRDFRKEQEAHGL